MKFGATCTGVVKVRKAYASPENNSNIMFYNNIVALIKVATDTNGTNMRPNVTSHVSSCTAGRALVPLGCRRNSPDSAPAAEFARRPGRDTAASAMRLPSKPERRTATRSTIRPELLKELLAGKDPKTGFESEGLLEELKKALA